MAACSGKTSQPPGACNGSAAEFSGVEQELYDYQMHTKMCKKIAQLTKVGRGQEEEEEERSGRQAGSPAALEPCVLHGSVM